MNESDAMLLKLINENFDINMSNELNDLWELKEEEGRKYFRHSHQGKHDANISN